MNELKSTYTHKNTDELMQHISESLLDLGFAPNLKGFIYVKEAIYIYMAKYHEDITIRDLLVSIAQKHSVTATSVNLTIRKSIELTWLSSRLNTKHKMFESSYIDKRFPPTNSEFIATMVEIIRINLRENDKRVG